MKDRVFIVWSGDTAEADTVKSLLLEKDYDCVVGGEFAHHGNTGSILQTVMQQIGRCNQAIVIFQNKENEDGVGRNLYFELGLVMASYGAGKIHCVRRKGEEIRFASDLGDYFVEPIDGADEDFAEGIVRYFLGRQNLAVEENKFKLINERNELVKRIKEHCSERGSLCSDYELAQYVLFYMQAAHMFNEEGKALSLFSDVYGRFRDRFSEELRIAFKFAIAYCKMTCDTVFDKDVVYLPEATFGEFEGSCDTIERSHCFREKGIFGKWIRCFVYESMNYACQLTAANPIETDETERADLIAAAREYAEKALECLDELCTEETIARNHDDKGLIALIRSYLFRDQFLIRRDEEVKPWSECNDSPDYRDWRQWVDYKEWLIAARNIRQEMMDENGNGIVDSQLYTTFCMEYYLTVSEYLDLVDEEALPSYRRRRYISAIEEFLKKAEEGSRIPLYIEQIRHNYDRLRKEVRS